MFFVSGGGAEKGHSGGLRKQTRHGPGDDTDRGGERPGPPRPERQEVADLQDLSPEGRRPGRRNGMVGSTHGCGPVKGHEVDVL